MSPKTSPTKKTASSAKATAPGKTELKMHEPEAKPAESKRARKANTAKPKAEKKTSVLAKLPLIAPANRDELAQFLPDVWKRDDAAEPQPA